MPPGPPNSRSSFAGPKAVWEFHLEQERNQGCISQQSLACRALKSPFKIHWVNDATKVTTPCETHPRVTNNPEEMNIFCELADFLQI